MTKPLTKATKNIWIKFFNSIQSFKIFFTKEVTNIQDKEPFLYYAPELNTPTANLYELNLLVTQIEGFDKKPSIITRNPDNYDIASFIRNLGVQCTQELIDDLNSLNAFNKPIHEIYFEGSYEELVKITSPPATAIFNTGGNDCIVPLQDFLSILQEWQDFLKSLSYEHSLSNR